MAALTTDHERALTLLFAELAATVKDRKQTVLEYLDDLYLDVGHYGERLINKYLEGREGVAEIKKLMAAFRTAPPKQVAGLTRARWSDMPQQRGIVITLRNDLAAEIPPVMGIESEIREAMKCPHLLYQSQC